MITIQVDTADRKVLPQILPTHREWLFSNIRRAGGQLELLPSGAKDSVKGPADIFSLAIPAAAVPAVVQIVKLWLKERGRVITFQSVRNGETQIYRLVGTVSDETVREVLNQAITQGHSQNEIEE